MRRYLALAVAALSFVLLTASSCNGTNNCPDDSEALPMSATLKASLKPTCKPVNPEIRWVEPSEAAKP